MINKNILEEQEEIRKLSTDHLKQYASAGGGEGGLTGILSAMELARRASDTRSAAGASVASQEHRGSVLQDLSRDAAAFSPAPQGPMPTGYFGGGLVQGYNEGGQVYSGSPIYDFMSRANNAYPRVQNQPVQYFAGGGPVSPAEERLAEIQRRRLLMEIQQQERLAAMERDTSSESASEENKRLLALQDAERAMNPDSEVPAYRAALRGFGEVADTVGKHRIVSPDSIWSSDYKGPRPDPAPVSEVNRGLLALQEEERARPPSNEPLHRGWFRNFGEAANAIGSYDYVKEGGKDSVSETENQKLLRWQDEEMARNNSKTSSSVETVDSPEGSVLRLAEQMRMRRELDALFDDQVQRNETTVPDLKSKVEKKVVKPEVFDETPPSGLGPMIPVEEYDAFGDLIPTEVEVGDGMYSPDAPGAVADSKYPMRLTNDRNQYARGLALLTAASNIASGRDRGFLGNVLGGLTEGAGVYQTELDKEMAQRNTEFNQALAERNFAENRAGRLDQFALKRADLKQNASEGAADRAHRTSEGVKDREYRLKLNRDQVDAETVKANQTGDRQAKIRLIGYMQKEISDARKIAADPNSYELLEGMNPAEWLRREEAIIKSNYSSILGGGGSRGVKLEKGASGVAGAR